MRVIPRSAVQRSPELVGEALPRSDGALADGGSAVFPRSTLLKEAMPVNCSTFFGASDVVLDCDLDNITPIGLDSGTRESAVDKKYRSLVAVRGDSSPADSPVIVPNNTGEGSAGVGIVAVVTQAPPRKSVRHGIVSQAKREQRG